MDDPSRRWVGREPKPYLAPAVERIFADPRFAQPDPLKSPPRKSRRCPSCGRRKRRFPAWLVVVLAMLAAAAVGRLALRIF